MKFIYICAIVFLLAACTPGHRAATNKPTPFITDSAGVFLPDKLAYIDSIYAHERSATGNTLILVTIRDYKPQASLHEYALKYFNDHELDQEGKHTYVLIIFCTSCNAVQILTSKGSESILTEPDVKSVINNVMIPRFRKGQDYDGLLNGSNAIIDFLNKNAQK